MSIRQGLASRMPAIAGVVAFGVLGLVGYLLVSLSESAWHQEKRFDAAEIASAEAVKLERKLVRLQFAAHLIESLVHNHQGDLDDLDQHLQELKDKFSWLAGYKVSLHPMTPGSLYQTEHRPARPVGGGRWLAQQPDSFTFVQMDGSQGALVLWQPVYLDLSEEENRLWGAAEIRLPWQQFIDDSGLPGLKQRGYDYRLYAKEPVSRYLDGSGPEVLDRPFTQPIILSGLFWSLEVAPDQTWGYSPWYPWVVGMTLFICLLLSAWVHQLMEQPRRLQRLVLERTQALDRQAALLAQEVEDRKRVAGQLRKEERRFRYLFENVADAIFVHDFQGRILDCNAVACDWLGYQREELLRLRVTDIDRKARSEDFGEQWLWGTQVSVSIRGEHQRKDGSSFPVEIHATPFEDGEWGRVVAVVRDITEQDREERLLRGLATAADWGIGEHFFDNAVIRLSGLFGFDVVFIGEISSASPDLLQMRAFSEGGALRKGFDIPLSSTLCGRVLAEGAVYLPERACEHLPAEHPFKQGEMQGYVGIPIVTSSGQCIGVLACLQRRPLRDGERLLAYLSIFASRAAAELERQRTADELIKLSRVVEQSPTSVVITDTSGGIEYVNPAFVRSTGYALEEVKGQTPRILKSGQQSLAFYQQLWRAILQGEDWQSEVCNRRKDGTLFWEHSAIYPIRNSGGVITNYAAIKQDITDRKIQEAKLKLSQVVFQSVTEAILITDGDSRITAVNPAFSRITGFSAEEVVGKTPALLKSDRHDKAFYDQMRQALVDQGHWEGEIWNRRKSGEVFPEWLSIVAVGGEEGAVEQFVAVFSDITQRKQKEELIRYQANYDALTALPNRLLFEDRLGGAVALSRRQSSQLALLFVDLDRFKWVNDTLGHKAGDLLLKTVAARLKACVRESDTVARLGGDEFTLVLANLDQAEYAERVAQMVVERLAEPFLLEGDEVEISASVGISLYPQDAGGIETLIQHADNAMYEAKQAGRNQYRFYTQAINELVHQRQQLERSLKQGLEREQFQLYFQPVLNLETGHCAGVEALLRWNHPQSGVMLPRHFLPVAERIGLMGPLGEWVIEEVARLLVAWHQQEWAPPWVSVNVSLRQCEDVRNANLFERLLALPGIEAQRLMVEVTEVVVAEHSKLRPLLAKLRDGGFPLAIDDFGRGESPLAYLQGEFFDYLKVDASLVQAMHLQRSSEALVRGLVQLAHNLGVKVIAEGVELEAQHQLLRAMGCDYAQGYYYCKPLSRERLQAFLQGTGGCAEND